MELAYRLKHRIFSGILADGAECDNVQNNNKYQKDADKKRILRKETEIVEAVKKNRNYHA